MRQKKQADRHAPAAHTSAVRAPNGATTENLHNLHGSLATVWSIAGGLVSCDSTAKFTLPDRKFYSIEAVTAFPVKIGDNGEVLGRVCGAALDPTDQDLPAELAPSDANGLEVVSNFISTNLTKPACANDQDNSIKENELINLTRVRTGSPATVGPQNFELQVGCVTTPGDVATCDQSAKETISAASVRYENIASRCNPDPDLLEGSKINVALVIDNSGSMKGAVDQVLYKEDAQGHFNPAAQFKDLASDWDGARFAAAKDFVASLNTTDRAVAYYYDELGVHVAASDSYICNSPGSGDDGQPCGRLDGTGVGCGDSGATCDPDPSHASSDTYTANSFPWQQCHAFGANSQTRGDLVNGIDQKAQNAADGRGSLWKAIQQAYTFLQNGGSASTDCDGSGGSLNAMHIVVLTDGPDTCVDGDDFSYVDMKKNNGTCRPTCASADAKWKELVKKMAKDGYPVHVHFVQFQAMGYKQPDARMLEMACRTDATYQFINSENFNKSKPDDFTHAISKAVNRVRNGLSGTWRVAYKWTSIANDAVFAKGAFKSLDAQFKFTDARFDSLSTAVNELDKDSWHFTLGTSSSGQEDRRAIVRIPCATNAECGGADDCSAGHCGEGGICVADAAPNGKPCTVSGGSGTGRCHHGTCVAGSTCADAIK